MPNPREPGGALRFHWHDKGHVTVDVTLTGPGGEEHTTKFGGDRDTVTRRVVDWLRARGFNRGAENFPCDVADSYADRYLPEVSRHGR